MIIANGTIQFVTKFGGGLDANGYPVKATKAYGCCIPCQYTASVHNFLATSEGEHYVQSSYSILVEHLSPCQKTETLCLRDRCGNVVKEASVIRFEPLDAVCQTRIFI